MGGVRQGRGRSNPFSPRGRRWRRSRRMRGRTGGKGLIRNDFQAPAARKDPSSGPLRGPPSPRRSEGIAILTATLRAIRRRHVPPSRTPGKIRQNVRQNDTDARKNRTATGQVPDTNGTFPTGRTPGGRAADGVGRRHDIH
jgi:hypothetical protein